MASSATTATPPLGTVLVVGGCGFLGYHLVRLLLDEGQCDAVAVLDTNIQRNRWPAVSYHAGDITSIESTRAIVAGVQPRVIIHTATPLPHLTRVDPGLYRRVIVDGTANLLACAAATPSVVAFVYTSTCAVIEGYEWHMVDERAPLLDRPLPRDPYRENKATADRLVRQANGADRLVRQANGPGLRTVCLRPGGLFGERDQLVIGPLLDELALGRTNVQMGSNSTRFDMVYVGNVADAHLLAARALVAADADADPAAPKVDGEAFFITNDDPWLSWDFITAIWAAAGHRPQPGRRVWVLPNPVALALASLAEWLVWLTSAGRRRPKHLARHLIEFWCVERTFSIQKAKDRLRYVPRVSVHDGIQRSVEYTLRERAAAAAAQPQTVDPEPVPVSVPAGNGHGPGDAQAQRTERKTQ
ncbi:MAG: erg26, C-3 sterol dehydrogenase [Phylliscum demangeonii]|nr:MAG: erg26, C-3 sterol dehydrogenase [Phylliscum demangeonii]